MQSTFMTESLYLSASFGMILSQQNLALGDTQGFGDRM